MSEREEANYRLSEYLADKAPAAVACAICMLAIASVLALMSVTVSGIAVVLILMFLSAGAVVAWDYSRKRSYYENLAAVSRELRRVRHLSAFLGEPSFWEGRLSWAAYDALSKCAGEEMAIVKEDADAYQNYIETWIHEVKTPIAASRLILARMRGPEATALRQELERIEAFVEQPLYFARSESLNSDYAIKEVVLADVAKEACKRNQNLLIASGSMPIIQIDPEQTAFADSSWLTFVLGQLLSNSAKYGAKTVRFNSWVEGQGTSRCVKLEVADDGQGIPEEDMPNIFARGFVGSNGRSQGSATGIGLYLCAKLCEAMGLAIEVFSEEGEGTRAVITLPEDRRLAETQGA